MFEGDSGAHLHGELPGERIPSLFDLWNAVSMAAIQAVHDHEECVWVPISLILLDQGLGLGINGEDGLVLLVTGSVVDASCGSEVSVLEEFSQGDSSVTLCSYYVCTTSWL